MSSLAQDLRYALRTFAKNPAFSAVAVRRSPSGSAPTRRSSPSWTAYSSGRYRSSPRATRAAAVPGPTQGQTCSDDDDA